MNGLRSKINQGLSAFFIQIVFSSRLVKKMFDIIQYVKCIICGLTMPKQLTNFLFADNGNEIRVCYRCDHA